MIITRKEILTILFYNILINAELYPKVFIKLSIYY